MSKWGSGTSVPGSVRYAELELWRLSVVILRGGLRKWRCELIVWWVGVDQGISEPMKVDAGRVWRVTLEIGGMMLVD